MSAFYPNPELVRHNLMVPYKGPLKQPLQAGCLIEVRGHIQHGAKRFHVNLMDDRGEIALHVNPRFDSNEVVLNSYREGRWESEVKGPFFPFMHNQPFIIVILVEPMEYKVALNGKHFASFPHRKMFSTVNTIEISGPHITVSRLEERMEPLRQASGDFVMPAPLSPSAPPAAIGVPNYGAPPVFPGPSYAAPMPIMTQSQYPPGTRFINPPMPFATPIPGGLRPGMVIAISGRPHAVPHSNSLVDAPILTKPLGAVIDAVETHARHLGGGSVAGQLRKLQKLPRFSINLQSGPNHKNHGDIAFHLNPRFDTGKVVRNSFVNGDWGAEENSLSRFPFRAGVHFDILIQVTADKFNVAVDGQHMFEFRHRQQPLSRFGFISVDGDVVLASLTL